jgi:hypothetical protein
MQQSRILQNEYVFVLKCITNRDTDRLDMEVMAKDPSFDWNIVWSEIEKQDKDTGYHMFNAILNNIESLVEDKSINSRWPFLTVDIMRTYAKAFAI